MMPDHISFSVSASLLFTDQFLFLRWQKIVDYYENKQGVSVIMFYFTHYWLITVKLEPIILSVDYVNVWQFNSGVLLEIAVWNWTWTGGGEHGTDEGLMLAYAVCLYLCPRIMLGLQTIRYRSLPSYSEDECSKTAKNEWKRFNSSYLPVLVCWQVAPGLMETGVLL